VFATGEWLKLFDKFYVDFQYQISSVLIQQLQQAHKHSLNCIQVYRTAIITIMSNLVRMRFIQTDMVYPTYTPIFQSQLLKLNTLTLAVSA